MTRRSLLLAALPASAPAKATLADLAWLAGNWQGKLPWGAIEEIWSPASEDVMMGMFRMSSGGKPSLYEFMLLEQSGEGVRLRIRHFNRAFVAREERDHSVDFDLTALDPASATFFVQEPAAQVTLIYRKTGSETLTVDFRKVPQQGKTEELSFPYRRAALPNR